MLELVQGFQAFLQTSPFSVRNQAEDTGFWHGFLLRCTWREPQQYMAMAIVNPKGVSDDDKTAEYDRMKSALPIGAVPGTTASLQSLFVQEYSGNSNPDVNTPCVLLAGSPTLSETLCGMTFKLSPQSFFQVNTLAAEKLYETVGELALGRDSAWDGYHWIDAGQPGEARDWCGNLRASSPRCPRKCECQRRRERVVHRWPRGTSVAICHLLSLRPRACHSGSPTLWPQHERDQDFARMQGNSTPRVRVM
jgi:hypothetical protein